jgi:hypothetical protein
LASWLRLGYGAGSRERDCFACPRDPAGYGKDPGFQIKGTEIA